MLIPIIIITRDINALMILLILTSLPISAFLIIEGLAFAFARLPPTVEELEREYREELEKIRKIVEGS
jgi:hypothetical protein